MKKILFSVLLALVGALVVFFSIWELSVVLTTPEWATTSGSIIDSDVRYSRKKYSNRDYLLHVKYEYVVAGVTYTSQRKTIGTDNDNWRGTEAALEAVRSQSYEVGTTVDVYYQPQNPNYAVLSTEYSLLSMLGWLLGGLIIIGMGGVLLFQD